MEIDSFYGCEKYKDFIHIYYILMFLKLFTNICIPISIKTFMKRKQGNIHTPKTQIIIMICFIRLLEDKDKFHHDKETDMAISYQSVSIILTKNKIENK